MTSTEQFELEALFLFSVTLRNLWPRFRSYQTSLLGGRTGLSAWMKNTQDSLSFPACSSIRKTWRSMIMTYNIVTGKVNHKWEDFFTFAQNQTNHYNLGKPKAVKDVRRNTSSTRVVNDWNESPFLFEKIPFFVRKIPRFLFEKVPVFLFKKVPVFCSKKSPFLVRKSPRFLFEKSPFFMFENSPFFVRKKSLFFGRKGPRFLFEKSPSFLVEKVHVSCSKKVPLSCSKKVPLFQ